MDKHQTDRMEFINNAKEAALHIGLLITIITVSFIIFKPFLVPLAWGIILAVALYPICKKTSSLLKGKKRLAAILIVLVCLALLIIPTIKISAVSIDGIQSLSENLEEGSIELPQVPESVKDWPLVGNKVWEIWNQVDKHISDGLRTVSPQLKLIGEKLAGSISGLIAGFFIFIFSIIMAGVFDNQQLEWNAMLDPHASAIVYQSNIIHHRSIGLDVTRQVTLPANEVRQRFQAPLLQPVLDFAEVWFEDHDLITFHDPLAATTIFDSKICSFQRGHIEIELQN